MIKTFTSSRPFTLECGETIPSVTIAYHTWGKINPQADNVVWVCHALTANSDVEQWWPGTIVPGRFLDPERYFIVCANVIGSCYGSTGPVSTNPDTGLPYGDTFPRVTVRDMVSAHRLLARHLSISSIHMLIGSSLGGFQCLEWAVTDPEFIHNLVLIATASYTRPWAAAFNEAQRMALESDPSFGTDAPAAGAKGLAAARAVAMLSYRGPAAYDMTQADRDADRGSIFTRRVASYQRHQGDKLAARFDPVAYHRMSLAVDSHNVGRDRGSIPRALATVKARTLVVAISSDILFPPSNHDDLARYIPHARFSVIDSDFGHDGFLIENATLDALISRFISEGSGSEPSAIPPCS